MSIPKIHVPPKIIYTREDGTKEIFISQEKLGHGGFAVVHRVLHQNSNKSYAMKVISKDRYASSKEKASLEKLRNEMQIQKSLNHPNIVQSKISFSDEFNNYIILEYCPGKSVRDYLRKSQQGYLSEPEARKILIDVIQGLIYLHSRRIIHHDIKLENFLIGSDGKVKIADFGISAVLKNENEKKYTFCGTANYLSPEIVEKENKGHSFEVDIWAVGVSAFIMLTGQQPFDGKNKEIIYEKIKNCEYHFPITIQLSYEAKDFIKTILQINPRKRPTADDLIHHPFLTKLDKERVQLYQPPQLPPKVQPVIPVQSFTPTHSFQKDQPLEQQQSSQKVQSFQKNQIYQLLPKAAPVNSNNNNNNNNCHNRNMRIPAIPSSSLRTSSVGIPRPAAQVSDECELSQKKSSFSSINNDNIHNSLPATYEISLNNIFKKNFNIPNQFVTKYCIHNGHFGYLLGDGTVGAIFGDQSRIVIDPNEEFIQYYKDIYSGVEVYELNEYLDVEDDESRNDKIYMKIALIRKFAQTFKKVKSNFELPKNGCSSSVPLHHVKYFIKKNDSYLFKFNDKNVQVNFNDHKKLIIFWKTNKMCLVRDLNETCALMNMNDVLSMNSNSEEFKKYKNAREMLALLSKKL